MAVLKSPQSIKNLVGLAFKMGPRYFFFRLFFEIRRRSGLLKSSFPTNVLTQKWLTKTEWKSLSPAFFFESRETLSFPKSDITAQKLEADILKIKQGYIQFFSNEWLKVSDWHTNPDTDYKYNPKKHWTEIPDFSAATGDIKYVWEKSRFSFLYSLIRYDYHASKDQSEFVFDEIESWIDQNPVNCGPNWRCSQEISLRVLNWTFALNYYKNADALSEARFEKIINSIYWQMLHVEANIDFSRIAVRNNHALTETLCLYLSGLLFPFFKEANRWKTKGKKWFEEEIKYQIYEDGTFLQFSMNYHRIVVQLLTWGIVLAEKNNEKWDEIVYERARKSLVFLQTCQDNVSGWLPNYGNNDGALFFKLNDAHYRDYHPQLEALSFTLKIDSECQSEDCFWYGINRLQIGNSGVRIANPDQQNAINRLQIGNSGVRITNPDQQKTNKITDSKLIQEFKNSGYYIFKEADILTFIRCGIYNDRPFQADNLHLDIWANGENLLRDAGSYKYNIEEAFTKYFAGTASHNTVMLGDFDQMQKGPRFVWYDWTKEATAITDKSENIVFDGKVLAFRQAGKRIYHRRKVTKFRNKQHWIIEDWIENKPDSLPIHQIWHPSDFCLKHYSLNSYDQNNVEIMATETQGWFSGLYGHKQSVPRLVFTTNGNYLRTVFCLK